MKLFVGNLNWKTTENDLEYHFGRFGDIEECRIITDRETGRSRGFGFITFAEKDQAEKAMEQMDGSDVDGRPIKVNEAKERQRNDNHRTNRW